MRRRRWERRRSSSARLTSTGTGRGYPDGLAGSEIPLGARIIAVCDAFDAMTSPRPYAKPLSIEQAIRELFRCAGTQFDPDVVEAFAAVQADLNAQLVA